MPIYGTGEKILRRMNAAAAGAGFHRGNAPEKEGSAKVGCFSFDLTSHFCGSLQKSNG
jgi:hypothetical protein